MVTDEDYKYIRQSIRELFAEIDKLKEKVAHLEQHSRDYINYIDY